MKRCERCQKNPATVRVDEQLANGQRAEHYLCRSCVEEMMSAMGQMGGIDGQGMQGTPGTSGTPFGFVPNNSNSASTAGGANTATATRQANNSKTPTLDQYGRDLTAE